MIKPKITYANGAIGTMLMEAGVGVTDVAAVTDRNPALLAGLYDRYISAGCDIIITNTIALRGDEGDIHLAGRAVDVARQAADRAARRVAVAASIGPGCVTDSLIPLVRAMGGADIILMETTVSSDEGFAAAALIREVYAHKPLIISATLGRDGNLPDGTPPGVWAAIMSGFAPVAVGLNCGTASAPVCEAIARVAANTDCGIYIAPSAGVPASPESPDIWADNVARAVIGCGDRHVIAGGCCNSTPAHITALRNRISDLLTDS